MIKLFLLLPGRGSSGSPWALFACNERQSLDTRSQCGGADSFRTSATYPLSLESHQSSLDQPIVISWGSFLLGDGPALGNSFYDDNPLNGPQASDRHACFLPTDVVLVVSLRLLYHLLPSPISFDPLGLKLNAWNRSNWDPWN
jgi:hypothetical protein